MTRDSRITIVVVLLSIFLLFTIVGFADDILAMGRQQPIHFVLGALVTALVNSPGIKRSRPGRRRHMTGSVMAEPRPSIGLVRSAVTFWLSFVVSLWTAHALGYFLHEFAHSFTAWILGYKANPLALTYGHLTPANLLIQAEVDENVEYAPVFALPPLWKVSASASIQPLAQVLYR